MNISKEAIECADKITRFIDDRPSANGMYDDEIAQIIQSTIDERDMEAKELIDLLRAWLNLALDGKSFEAENADHAEAAITRAHAFLNKTEGDKK